MRSSSRQHLACINVATSTLFGWSKATLGPLAACSVGVVVRGRLSKASAAVVSAMTWCKGGLPAIGKQLLMIMIVLVTGECESDHWQTTCQARLKIVSLRGAAQCEADRLCLRNHTAHQVHACPHFKFRKHDASRFQTTCYVVMFLKTPVNCRCCCTSHTYGLLATLDDTGDALGRASVAGPWGTDLRH